MEHARDMQSQGLGGLLTTHATPIHPGPSIRQLETAIAAQHAGNDWFFKLKTVLFKNFEAALVLVLLSSLLFINFFVVHKFAFLLFYFIPVLLAGFYVGTKQAVFAALLATGFVVYTTLMQGGGGAQAPAAFNFWNLLIWSSFLILTGAIVGRLQEKNQIHLAQLQEAYVGIISILTKYLESADAYTKSHSERVAAVSTELAIRLGLPAEAVQNIKIAALLHDIGKIEVIELIQRAAELDPQEKEQVDSHTQLGAQLLLTAGTVLQDAIPIVLDHHRRYDDGREAIPIGARILAVADAYDAIVSDRPYRAGRHHWQAIELLQEAAGGQFDPQVVDVLRDAKAQVTTVYEAA
ncbi:MAG: HD domain-containing protein [Gemmatimonadota bacterium]|nr:MAG: HD domain-containing protein [Gemmatimonadota bacterium]